MTIARNLSLVVDESGWVNVARRVHLCVYSVDLRPRVVVPGRLEQEETAVPSVMRREVRDGEQMVWE